MNQHKHTTIILAGAALVAIVAVFVGTVVSKGALIDSAGLAPALAEIKDIGGLVLMLILFIGAGFVVVGGPAFYLYARSVFPIRSGQSKSAKLVFEKRLPDLLDKRGLLGTVVHESYAAWSRGEGRPRKLFLAAFDRHIGLFERSVQPLRMIEKMWPRIGFLGTAFGLAVSFASLGNTTGAEANQVITAGLSVALHTTVVGLVAAVVAGFLLNFLDRLLHKIEASYEELAEQIEEVTEGVDPPAPRQRSEAPLHGSEGGDHLAPMEVG